MRGNQCPHARLRQGAGTGDARCLAIGGRDALLGVEAAAGGGDEVPPNALPLLLADTKA